FVFHLPRRGRGRGSGTPPIRRRLGGGASRGPAGGGDHQPSPRRGPAEGRGVGGGGGRAGTGGPARPRPHLRSGGDPQPGEMGDMIAEIGNLDETNMWLELPATVPVWQAEERLRSRGLTLGSQPPSVLRRTVREWL